MRMYIKLLSTVCLCALVSACSKNQEPSAQEQSPFPFETQTETQTQGAPETSEFARFDGNLNENNFKVTVTPAEFGKYVLSLKWDKTIETMQVRVSNGPTMTKRNLYEHTQKVEAGKSLKIHFAVLNGNNETVSVMDVDIETPFDFLVKEPLHLKEDTEWHLGRLHILPGGQIMTNGARLTIHADEIHHHQPEFTSVNMDMAKHSVVNLETAIFNQWHIGAHSEINITTSKLIGGFSIFTQTKSTVIYSNNGPHATWADISVQVQDHKQGNLSIVRNLISEINTTKSIATISTNIRNFLFIDKHERPGNE